MKMTELADKIAEEASLRDGREGLRDYCDLRSGGELDPLQLDLLTDAVFRRLARKR